MPSLIRTVVWTALVASSVGCVLLTGVDDVSSTCRFQGEMTPCGACIRESCLAAVDACCGDPACGATLGQLDKCATAGSAEACGPLVAAEAAYTSDGIAACVRNACGDACGLGSGDAGPRPDASSLPGCGPPLATTACGTCLTSYCGPALATCCGDKSGACLTHMEQVAACASKGTFDTCLRLSIYNGYTPPAGASLNACVSQYCADVCPMVPSSCLTGLNCGTCCASAYPTGYKNLMALDSDCACSPSTCLDSCKTSLFCQADAAQTDQTCETCLQQNQGWGQRCGLSAKCYADLECEKFTVCAKTCQAQ